MASSKMVPPPSSEPHIIYCKVTTQDEIHHGFQYKTGLNTLKGPFNSNPKDSCVAGGLYYTSTKYVDKFYHFGRWLRIIKLPVDQPGFCYLRDSDGDKWRANMLILEEKYDLRDFETYVKFQIPIDDSIKV